MGANAPIECFYGATPAGSGLAVGVGATTYGPVAACHQTANFTVETAENSITYRTAGVFSLLCMRVSGASMVTRVRIDSGAGYADGTLTVTSVAAGVVSDILHTDTIAAGDKVTYKVTNNAIAVRNLVGHVMTFAASGTTVTKIGAAGQQNNSTASTTRTVGCFANIFTPAHGMFLQAFTLSSLHSYVSANGRSTTSTFDSYVNGANGNQQTSYAAFATGHVEDVLHTDTTASGDTIQIANTLGSGTGNLAVRTVDMEVQNSDGVAIMGSANTAGVASGSGLINLLGLNGNITDAGGVSPSLVIGFAGAAEQLTVRVTVNTRASGTSTVELTNTTSGTGLIASVAAGVTGYVTDLLHTATITTTDQYRYAQNVPTSTGTITGFEPNMIWHGAPDTNIGAIDGVPYEEVKTVHGLSHADNLVKSVQGVE